MIGEVDCTASGEALCSKFQVQGYPTLKVFKKGGNIMKGEEYNGGRDFNAFNSYVQKNLAGPECSLEDKEGCAPEELKILEESEKLSTADRRAKVTVLEETIKDQKKQMKELENNNKELGKTLELYKAGGEKADKVEQLLGDAEFREHCEHRTCVLAFLPHILDGGAAERNDHLKKINSVFKKAKTDGHPVGFMWLQGGDQFEIEEKLSLQFGFPAIIAINLKKERFGTHRGTWSESSLSEFLSSMMLGKVPLSPIPKGLKWTKADPWDGKDGDVPAEEEL